MSRLALLLRYRWVAAIGLVLVGAAAGAAAERTAPLPAATSTVVLVPAAVPASDVDVVAEVDRAGLTVARLARTAEVAAAAVTAAGVDRSPGGVAAATSGTNPVGTRLVELTVRDPDPAVAAALADAVAEAVIERVDELVADAATGSVEPLVGLALAERAGVPAVPAARGAARDVVAGAGVGLAAGAALLVAAGLLDPAVRRARDLEGLGLAVLARPGEPGRGRRVASQAGAGGAVLLVPVGGADAAAVAADLPDRLVAVPPLPADPAGLERAGELAAVVLVVAAGALQREVADTAAALTRAGGEVVGAVLVDGR